MNSPLGPYEEGALSAGSPADLRDLVRRAKSGDIAAFEQIYHAYGRKILNYIYHMTGSREESEDLTQETFVTVFQKLNTLRDDSRFEPWLFTIARNYIFQRYRSRPAPLFSLDTPRNEDERAEIQRVAGQGKSPEEETLSDELQQVISRAIASLAPKYREVFVLAAVRGMSYQDIAELTGRTMASVKTDIHRARLVVRDRVKRYLREGRDELPSVSEKP